MNLNHLAIFHAVAEEGSVKPCATRLFISQPAVSKQLAEFERTLGTPLFDRLPRGMRLTEAGETLAIYARRLFAVEADAERALQEIRGLERGRLHVGASLTTGVYLLPELLARFHARHPGITIEMEVANTGVIQQRLLDGILDVAFTEGFADDPNLEATVFDHDELVAILPVNYAPFADIAAGSTISIERFCREPMILREAGSGTRAVLEMALEAAGAPPRNVAMTLASTEAIKRAVMLGAGVAFVSKLAIAEEIPAGRLRLVQISEFTIRRPLHRLHVRGRHESPTVRALSALLVNPQT